MKIELIVALIAGAVALASAGASAWASLKVDRLKRENDNRKAADQKQKKISRFSEPLARSAFDLQSRLYNLLNQELIKYYLIDGNERERSYVVSNTVFLIGQYFCWTELARNAIQFIDLGESSRTRELLHLQDTIYNLWGTDRYGPLLRIFAGEQRAIGEALIQTGAQGAECKGYGAFLKSFNDGENPLIDAVRADVASLSNALSQASERLTRLQHALIDLLQMLDPEYLRFPKHSRLKI